ncbi:MAG: response regulator transcription factor [Saccharofermentans sp.]|nr:response regulator transcription factor [Saccharofermentans sp.]
MIHKYLIVEDSTKIREGVCEYFEMMSQGSIMMDQAATGTEGLAKIKENKYDLVILDIMLPGASGFDICKELRKTSDCPVFFLTALGNEENILKGYEIGGDDYIVKPFSVKELYCKAEALVRRMKSQEVKSIKMDELELNPFTMQVFVNGVEIELPPKEYFILKLLMENKGQVFSRESIINRVWEYDFDGTDRVVDSQIKKLRKNLGESGKRIVTLFGRGYKIQ